MNDITTPEKSNGLKMGSYALGFSGKDYHRTVQESLIWLGMRLKEKYQDLDFRLSLDVHPVLERDLAWKAGLGWDRQEQYVDPQAAWQLCHVGRPAPEQKSSSHNKRL